MDATSAAKQLAQRTPDLDWPEVLPQCLYNLNVPALPSGSASIELGERFHENMEKHLNGGWVAKEHYYACSAVGEILSDLNVERKSLKTELVLNSNGITGRADIVGKDLTGRDCVVEIKTTQGNFALRPEPHELAQLAFYADMLKFELPRLICLRVNFRLGKVAVFIADYTRSNIKSMLQAA